MTDRIESQIAFLREADQLKSVLRASRLIDGTRFENSAEHSWHIMLYALVLSDHAEQGVSVDRVLRMLLIHDIVEIDAGDAPIHGNVDKAAMAAKEAAAADRLFGLLPDDIGQEFLELWHEFEAADSPDARFAKSIDRLQTPVSNLVTGGGSWVDYDVSLDQLRERVGVPIQRGTPRIWDWLLPKLKAFFSE